MTDGRPEPDGDNHDDKDEKDDIFRSHCSASFLGEGDAAPRRTSPPVNGSMFLLVFGLLAMSAAVSCALSAIRAADADFPPFFGPITGKTWIRGDADKMATMMTSTITLPAHGSLIAGQGIVLFDLPIGSVDMQT